MIQEQSLLVEGLKISFTTGNSEFEAIKNLSFELLKGECLGIVGESGSGKSVTSLALMGLLAKNAKIGAEKLKLSFSGEHIDIQELSAKGWREVRGKKVSMIFQEPMSSLNPVMTCGDQVAEALLYRLKLPKQEVKKRCLQLFEEVKLPDPEKAFNSYPHQLSGGQRQRVMIAMALSCNPDILIADEPTTALDVTVQKNILELIADLRNTRGMSVIFITHDLGVVAAVAQKIAVLYRGELVEYGTAEEVLKNPVHAYTKGLLACRPSLHQRVERLPSLQEILLHSGNYPDLKIRSIETERQKVKELNERPTILELNKIVVEYPGIKKGENFRAVNQVDLYLKKGETLGLVGESGCGKSTLSRAIMRLSPITSGNMIFEGQEIGYIPESQFRAYRKKMQLIFQDPYSSLNPKIRIGDAITEPMKVHGLNGNEASRKNRAFELLDEVGLKGDFFNRYPHEFSGGQRQRIVIARALAVEPEFLICDESVAALDVSVQAQVLNLLADLRDKYKLSMIFISHDLSVVAHMSNRIAVMYRGQIEEVGITDDIVSHPQSPYTQKLISSIPEL